MNLQTFTARTMHECLQEVKRVMGPNAVILHTRTYTKRAWLGVVRHEFVEITAGKPMGSSERRPPTKAPINVMASKTLSPFVATMHSASTNVALAAPGKELLNSSVATGIMTQQVAKDVDELKKMVVNLVDQMHKKDVPNIPEELFEHYMGLIANHVADELAKEIIGNLRKQLRPEHLQNKAFIKEKLAEQIEKLIPTTGPIKRTKTTGPHVVALIGPTGVGKTTTIAKLAANLKLFEKRRVGLITIDTYRIAAIDQLRKYAKILQAELRVTNNADDLRDAVKSMHNCEYVLIDTAGRSPRDMMKINELKTFLDAACPDEIHLVLSSTASQDCAELAIEKFGEVHFDKIIFTKLDEAAHVGVMLNAIHKLNKSLSYITTGQDVPDDIEIGEGRRLARLILGDNL